MPKTSRIKGCRLRGVRLFYVPRSAYGTMVQTPYTMAWGPNSYSLQIYDNGGYHQCRYGMISLVLSARHIWFWSMLRLGFLLWWTIISLCGSAPSLANFDWGTIRLWIRYRTERYALGIHLEYTVAHRSMLSRWRHTYIETISVSSPRTSTSSRGIRVYIIFCYLCLHICRPPATTWARLNWWPVNMAIFQTITTYFFPWSTYFGGPTRAKLERSKVSSLYYKI